MSGRNKGKAKIHISKPEPPPFLQRMKEQIVANEDAVRKEQSERKRKDRPGKAENVDDDPTIVKLNDEDLTEEEYKRMKMEMETQYKLDSESARSKPDELDVDSLIQIGRKAKDSTEKTQDKDIKSSRQVEHPPSSSKSKTSSKKLSYGSSSSDEED